MGSPLKGKCALVTGSTSGIGQGIARSLAEQGCNVVLNGFGDAGQIEQDRAALEVEHGVKVLYCGANMKLPGEIESMFAEIEAAFGGVDILVNNAGIQCVSPIEDFPVGKWDDIIAINLSSVFHCTRLCLGHMKGRGWGRVVNVASAHALVASKFKSAYVAAKHGVLGFTKTTALECAQDGITCNAICPGYVQTPLVEKQVEEQASAHGISREAVIRDVLLASQPNKAFVQVSEIASLVVFLCGPGGRSMTGAALPIDGAWTAH